MLLLPLLRPMELRRKMRERLIGPHQSCESAIAMPSPVACPTRTPPRIPALTTPILVLRLS
ncbi:hypothetical protein ACSBR1_027888 [Camellia fascicularis]